MSEMRPVVNNLPHKMSVNAQHMTFEAEAFVYLKKSDCLQVRLQRLLGTLNVEYLSLSDARVM